MATDLEEHLRTQKIIFGRPMTDKPLHDLMITERIPQEIVLRLLDKLPQHKPDEHFKIDRYVKFIHGKTPSSFQVPLFHLPSPASPASHPL